MRMRRHKFMRSGPRTGASLAVWGVLVALAVASMLSMPAAFAADVQIVEGSAGSSCDADMCLSPSVIRVVVGDTVTWTNGDSATHTITSGVDWPDGNFHSGFVQAGGVFSYQFTKPGEYPYYSLGYPLVSGVVVVDDGAQPADSMGDGAQPADSMDDGAQPADSMGDGAQPADSMGDGAQPADLQDAGPGNVNDPSDAEIFFSSGKTYALIASLLGSSVTVVDITDVTNPMTVTVVRDGEDGFDSLATPSDIEIFESSGGTYALVASLLGDTIQIMDVSTPNNPLSLDSIHEGKGEFAAVSTIWDMEVYDISDRKYVFVAGASNNVFQIIDMSDPNNPKEVAVARAGDPGFEGLMNPSHIEVFESAGSTYALVTSLSGGAGQLVDVTVPESPAPVSRVDQGGFGALSNIVDAAVFTSDGRTYVMSVGAGSGAPVRTVDITDANRPVVVGREDTMQAFAQLQDPKDVEVFDAAGSTYALVSSFANNTIYAADIGNPAMPSLVASAASGQDGFDALDNPWDIEVFESFGMTYALVTHYGDDTAQLINVTDPSNPMAAGIWDPGRATSGVLLKDIEVIVGPEMVYALLTGTGGGEAVRVLDITDLNNPSLLAVVQNGQDGFDDLNNPWDIDVFDVSDRTYAFTVSLSRDAVQILDITNISAPVVVSSVEDGRGGFDALYDPRDAEAYAVSGGTYILVTASGDAAVQIINVTDPKNPVPAGVAQNNKDGFDALSGPREVAIAEVSGRIYAVVGSIFGNEIQVIDVTDPARPMPAGSAKQGQSGFALAGIRDIQIYDISGRTYAFTTGLFSNTVSVIDISNPDNPLPAGSAKQGEGGFEAIASPNDADLIFLSGKVYAAVTSYATDAVQIMDITDPTNLIPVAVMRQGQAGFDALNPPDDLEVFVVDGTVYGIVAGDDSRFQLMVLTDPANPTPAGTGTYP